MFRTHGLTILLLVGLGALAPAQVFHHNPANDRVYVLTAAGDVFAARQAASQLGGTLVAVNDAAEQAFLNESFGSAEAFWIGLSDELTEGTFTWDSGEAVAFTNWAAGQPDDGGGSQNWTIMNAGPGGGWGDVPFDEVRRGIVELPSTYNPANGHVYLKTGGVTDVFEAREAARALGGYLVAINDAAEAGFLTAAFGTGERYWLGLSDEVVEGDFRWDSGEPLTYTNWLPGQPNDSAGIEDWAYFNQGAGGEWNDSPSSGGSFGVARGIIEIGPRMSEHFAVAVVSSSGLAAACPSSANTDPEQILDLPASGGVVSLCGTSVIVVRLGVTLVDGPGADLVISERTAGLTERYRVAVSMDGVAWTNIPGILSGGTYSASSAVDIAGAGVSEVNFVRVTGASGQTSGSTPGPDLDGIEVIHYRTPRFAGAPRIYADTIVSANTNGDTTAALGAPDASGRTVYTSSSITGSSFEGQLVLSQGDDVVAAFRDHVILDGPGVDFIVHEHDGPEGDALTIEVSLDGSSWFALTPSLESAPRYGAAAVATTNVLAFDVSESGLPHAELVRITATANAPDVDAVEIVHAQRRRRTGTLEDFAVETRVDGQGVPDAVIKLATAGSVYTVDLVTPQGSFADATPVVLGQVLPVANAFAPVPGLPELLIDPLQPGLLLILDGNAVPAPFGPLVLSTGGVSMAFAMPPGLSGLRLRLQGLALAGAAANGIFAASDASDLLFF